MASQYSVVSKTLSSSDDTLIYAEAIGDPTNPCVVLVHGIALSAAVYDNLFFNESLLDRFYMVRFDLRGHGRSGKPLTLDGHASTLYADDFRAVAKAFDLHRPVFVGWSYGCSLLADICAHIQPMPLSGALYLAALPYTGPILPKVATPAALGYLADLGTPDDTGAYHRAHNTFLHDLWREPEAVPFALRASWLGQTLVQPPIVMRHIVVRPQEPEGLHAAGRAGLPLMVVYGTDDKVVNGEVAATELRPHFKDLEVLAVPGGSHALFYDSQEVFVQALLKFVSRVTQ